MCEPTLLGRVAKRSEVCIENIFRIVHEPQTVLEDKTEYLQLEEVIFVRGEKKWILRELNFL